MGFFDFLSMRIKTEEEPTAAAGSQDQADNAAMLYFKAAAVDTAISYVVNALSNCEIKVFKDGKETKGFLHYLLNVHPNPVQNSAQFREDQIYRLMLAGESLVVPIGDAFYVCDGFLPYDRAIGDRVWTSVSVNSFGVGRDYPSDKAIYLSWGDGKPKSFLNGMFESYVRLLDSAVKGFEASAGSKWLLNIDNPAIGDRAFAKNDMKERQDPTGAIKTFMRHANSVYVQYRGQSLEKVDVSGCSSSDVINIRKDAFEAVASVFKIPPPMLFGNMTNLDEILDSFLTFTIKPLARQMSDEYTDKLIGMYDAMSGSKIVVDTSRIKAIDIFDVSSSISQLIGSGFSLDEIREQIDWPKIGTAESQEHLITRNFGPLDEVLRQLAQGGEQNSR